MERYSPTERLGVNAVEKIILADFKWIFRDQPLVDVGIDALIEQAEEGEPLGKFIAFQIKSGLGNFHSTKDKLTYYVSNIHYYYWLKVELPLILIAYIPETDKTYWSEISAKSIKKTKKQWKIEIPLQNELNIKAKNIIEKLLIKKESVKNSIKIFSGEQLEESTIFDITEKCKCLFDARDSMDESERLTIEFGKKIDENQAALDGLIKYPTISRKMFKAVSDTFAKHINIYSKRLDNECQIFAETIAQGYYYQEQSLLIIGKEPNTNSLLFMSSSLQVILVLIKSLKTIIPVINLRLVTNKNLPEDFTDMKTAKQILIATYENLIDEYNEALSILIRLKLKYADLDIKG